MTSRLHCPISWPLTFIFCELSQDLAHNLPHTALQRFQVILGFVKLLCQLPQFLTHCVRVWEEGGGVRRRRGYIYLRIRGCVGWGGGRDKRVCICTGCELVTDCNPGDQHYMANWSNKFIIVGIGNRWAGIQQAWFYSFSFQRSVYEASFMSASLSTNHPSQQNWCQKKMNTRGNE